ncbi:hypothetical protein BO443_270008 [Burkholderia orbicola]
MPLDEAPCYVETGLLASRDGAILVRAKGNLISITNMSNMTYALGNTSRTRAPPKGARSRSRKFI